VISPYGKPHTTIIGWAGFTLVLAGFALHHTWLVVSAGVVTFLLLMFFRDPRRRVPYQRGVAVAPADGRVTSIHDVTYFEPFDGPAKCIRIFLSIFDVHVNRAPCYGRVVSITHTPGKYLNALRPESAEQNESVLIVLDHPTHRAPQAAVRQVAGAIARRIVTGCEVDDILQRGQRFGLIKFGSTTELYLPDPETVDVQVDTGDYVYGGATILARVQSSGDARIIKPDKSIIDAAVDTQSVSPNNAESITDKAQAEQ